MSWSPFPTWTTWRIGSKRSDSPRVFETGDKFVGKKIPTRYTDYSVRTNGLLEAYKKHIADRSYQG